MTLSLTQNSLNALAQPNIKNNIIIVIAGIPFVFGSLSITKLWEIGDDDVEIGQPDLLIGGVVPLANSRAYVSLDKTTKSISNQIEIDKGGSGSIRKFTVELVDKDQELTQFFRPGNFVTDLLGTEAEVYLLFEGTNWKDDAIRLFSGIIDQTVAAAGSWRITVAHPDSLKKAEVFEEINTSLDGAIDNSVTSLNVASAVGIIIPQDTLRTFIRIDDEIIEIGSIASNTLSSLTRGALGTIAAAHDDEAEVVTLYMIEGSAIDLALKLMLSNDGNLPFLEEVEAVNFEQITPSEYRDNSFLVENRLFQDENGLSVGDLVTITGATNGANNVVNKPIISFEVISEGTIVTLSGVTFVSEVGSSALASFNSQFNVFPSGSSAGMNPRQVDVEQHLFIKDTFGAGFPEYQLLIKESTNVKDILAEEIYFPSGLISAPRQARSSVIFTTPPLVISRLTELDESNVKNPDKLELNRTINSNFYNTIVYRFAIDALEDKFNAGEIIFSQTSRDRIKTPTKSLRIDSKGLIDDAATRTFIAAQSRRYIDRFRFAAEEITINVHFAAGFPLEVGDAVLFGSSALQLVDLEEGDRDFAPRLFEVTNQSINLVSGDVSLTLLDTKFGSLNDARFGVISPASRIAAGSTTTEIRLVPSFGETAIVDEREKWRAFIGEEITIRTEDFSFEEVVTLISFSSSRSDALNISPLSITPTTNHIVDLPEYPTSSDPGDRSVMKSIHCFFTPRVLVVTGVSNFAFTVSPSDISKFLVGGFVRVHNNDFSIDSRESISDDDPEIVSVNTMTNTVTVDRDLGFTPAVNYEIDLIGFADGGAPYRLI